jgi:DNA-binding Lrp family transcriptional regulator
MDMIRDTAFETALIGIIGAGLPLVSRPYAAIAERLGRDESEVIDGIRRLAMRGDLKRFGIVVRHRQLGYRANGMVVWDIPDERMDEIGPRIGAYAFVTLCYRRPRRLPGWRYNLFSMVHGRDRDTVEAQVGSIVEELQLQDIERRILFSRRCFKQRGASYRQADCATAPAAAARAVNE